MVLASLADAQPALTSIVMLGYHSAEDTAGRPRLRPALHQVCLARPEREASHAPPRAIPGETTHYMVPASTMLPDRSRGRK